MKIIQARTLGMCGGVRRALRIAERIADPEKTTILGEIVHNGRVARRMASLGFSQQEEGRREELPATPAVMVTAHGMSRRRREGLKGQGKEVIDATCPLVRKIQWIARDFAERGYFLVLIGRSGHAEVRAVTEDLPRFAIVEQESHVGVYPVPRIAVICQSTTRQPLAERLLEVIERKNPHAEIRFENTICAATRVRQRAVRELLPKVDALIVVGDPASNNSRSLVRLAQDAGKPGLLVSGAEDLDPEALEGCETVGLTAGASTPDGAIDEVRVVLRKLGTAREAEALP